jgi:diguanylate cyclase
LRQLTETADRLHEMARHDALTGLPNRRSWNEQFPRILQDSLRTGAVVSVALLDLDRFKRYNDTHGHQAGDRFLKQIAGTWSENLRTGDILARYGGEEFALALPGTNLEHSQQMLQRLCETLPDGQSASAGVCQWDGEESAEQLTARADTLLYAAKAAGRARVLQQ